MAPELAWHVTLLTPTGKRLKMRKTGINTATSLTSGKCATINLNKYIILTERSHKWAWSQSAMSMVNVFGFLMNQLYFLPDQPVLPL